MSDRIKLTPEELRGLGNDFKARAQQVRDLLDVLMGLVNTVDAEWDGRASETFMAAYLHKQPYLHKLEEALDSIGLRLHEVARDLEAADDDMSNFVESSMMV